MFIDFNLEAEGATGRKLRLRFKCNIKLPSWLLFLAKF